MNNLPIGGKLNPMAKANEALEHLEKRKARYPVELKN